jgi:branched-chain amino acid transport system substrate-binding protein
MQITLTRMRVGAVVLACVAALGLSSCSSDSAADDKSGSSETLEVADGGLTGDPIKIGTLCSCSGPLAASLGQSLEVLKAWGSWTNSNGGINGHPVEVVAYDDGQNPATALSQAKKLVEEDGVMAIVGTMSLVSDSWASYVDEKGIPVVGGQPVDTGFFTDPNFFASGSTLPLLLLGEVTLAKQAGAESIGLFYCSETPVCAQLPAIVGPLAEQAGLSVESAKVSSTAPNYIAPCLAFKDKGVDAVFSAVNSDVVPRIADSCAKQGYEPIQIASSATTQKSWTEDPNLDGSIFAATNAVYTDTSIPGVKDFIDGLTEFAPDVLDSPQFSYPLLYPWAGGQLFKAAAEAADISPTSTGADVVAGLHSLQGETLDGIAPPLTFPEGQPGFPLCYFSGTIAGGSFNSDNGGEPTCIDQETAGALLAALAG